MTKSAVYKPQVVNSFLAICLLFLSASFVSLDVFAVPVEEYSPSLLSVWSKGMGLSSLVYSIWSFVTVAILNVPKQPSSVEDSPSSINRRLRIWLLPNSLIYLLMVASIPGLNRSSSWILVFALMIQGAPYCYFYLLGVDALTAWFPTSPAFAMTLVSVSNGFSQFICAPSFRYLITYLGLINSIFCVSTLLFTFSLICGFYLEYPNADDLSYIEPMGTIDLEAQEEKDFEKICTKENELSSTDQDNDSCPSSSDDEDGQKIFTGAQDMSTDKQKEDEYDTAMPWYKVMQYAKFYRFLLIVFIGRAGMALLPYYFKLGYVFNVPTNKVVIAYQLFSVCLIFWSISINSLYEYLKKRFRSKVISKVFLALACLAQAILFAALVPISRDSKGFLAMIVVSVLLMIDESQATFSMLFAGDLFGLKNCVTVFGLAGGLADGPGEAFFTCLMSIIEEHSGSAASVSPSTFSSFYWISSAALAFATLLVAV